MREPNIMTLPIFREEGIFMKRSFAFGLFIIFIAASLVGFAQYPAAAPSAKTVVAPPGVESFSSVPDAAVTRHAVKIGGKTLTYTATAGMMPMRDENGKLQAEMFYIAYTLDGVTDRSKRPLLISFNGGPGSSSVWMHLGFLGPRKVVYDEEGFQLQPPYKLEDNESSILDEADLVFIDPIATGYSRMTPGEDLHKFHGLTEDLESVGEFIRLYATRNGRWESPKFIIGESYGTTRAAGLTGYLLSEYGMYLNGTILVSSMTLGVSTGADIDAMLILPHYTATAWYHKKLPPDLQAKPLRQVLDEAEKFAQGDYLGALVRGNGLTGKELDEIAARISRYAGVSANYVKQNNLRIGRSQFRKELLGEKGLTVGRLDSRYAGIDRSPNGESPEYDPAMAAWSGPFTGAVNSYFKNELKYATDRSYNIFGDVGAWRGMSSSGAGMMGGRPAGVGEMLRQAMAQNPFQRVLVLAGYYDAGCDYFSAEYAFSHLDPAGSFKDRVAFRYYECGHMMYIRKADLAKAKADLTEFIRSALPKS
jgi:carboxypeptidase C (cathepsin A)